MLVKNLRLSSLSLVWMVGMLLAGMYAVRTMAQSAGGHPAHHPPAQDMQRQRQAYFLRGRRSLDSMPAAEHTRLAWAQARRLPRASAGSRQRQLAQSNLPVTSGAWSEVGPSPENDVFYGNISGRITSLAVDLADDPTGNTVYIGAAYGGIWKSTNALSTQATWTQLTDSQPTLAVGAIALTTSSTAGVPTIVVGTGEPNNAGDSYYGMGILVSHDGGATWTQVTSADSGKETFFGGGFSKILVDPQNPQILLAGLATTSTAFNTSYTRGVYRSTDGGNTWSLVLEVTDSSGNNYSCTDLVYDAATQVYLAAIRGFGFYKSTNQGANWTALSASPFVKASPSISSSGYDNFYRASMAARVGVIYALIADSSGIISTPTPCSSGQTSGCDTGLVQSTNDGGAWTQISAPVCTSAQISAGICQTGDPLFNVAGPGFDQGDYDQSMLAPPNSSALVVGGIDLWEATTVNGMATTWNDITNAYGSGIVHADEHAIAAVNATTWDIGNDGGIWSTLDSGTNWTDLNTDLGTIQFYSVTSDPVTPGVYFGGSQDNDSAISGDGANPPDSGTPPLEWTADYFGDGGFTATTLATVNGTQEDQYFAENNYISLARSDQGGSVSNTNGTFSDSFYNNSSGTPNVVVDGNIIKDSSDFYVPYQVLPTDNSQIILGTCRVWEGPSMPSSDGAGWVAISPDLTSGGSGTNTCATNGDYITALAQAPSNSATIYAVTTDGRVAYTTNATCIKTASCATGAQPTWQTATPLPLTATAYIRPLSSVAVDPSNAQKIYVGVMDFGVNEGTGAGGQHIFMSTDAGNSWTDITGNLPDSPLNWILVDPQSPQIIYVAMDVGVFVAQDGGGAGSSEQWQQLGSGLPSSAVMQLNLTTTGPRNIIAATHGRGAWVIAALANTGPGFTLSANPASDSLSAGQSASYTLSVTPYNGFTGNVSLTCSGAPAGAACSINPSTVSISSSAAAQATVSVTTTAASAGPLMPSTPGAPLSINLPALLSLIGLGCLLLAAIRKRRSAAPVIVGAGQRARRLAPRLAWLGLAFLALALAGCGSSNKNSGTPSGTYSLTVTATSGSISQEQSLGLVVN